jgi:hypothetical protein
MCDKRFHVTEITETLYNLQIPALEINSLERNEWAYLETGLYMQQTLHVPVHWFLYTSEQHAAVYVLGEEHKKLFICFHLSLYSVSFFFIFCFLKILLSSHNNRGNYSAPCHIPYPYHSLSTTPLVSIQWKHACFHLPYRYVWSPSFDPWMMLCKCAYILRAFGYKRLLAI